MSCMTGLWIFLGEGKLARGDGEASPLVLTEYVGDASSYPCITFLDKKDLGSKSVQFPPPTFLTWTEQRKAREFMTAFPVSHPSGLQNWSPDSTLLGD